MPVLGSASLGPRSPTLGMVGGTESTSCWRLLTRSRIPLGSSGTLRSGHSIYCIWTILRVPADGKSSLLSSSLRVIVGFLDPGGGEEGPEFHENSVGWLWRGFLSSAVSVVWTIRR